MNNIIIYTILTFIFIIIFCIIGSILHKKVEIMSKEYAKIKNDKNQNGLNAHTKAILVAAISGYFAK